MTHVLGPRGPPGVPGLCRKCKLKRKMISETDGPIYIPLPGPQGKINLIMIKICLITSTSIN